MNLRENEAMVGVTADEIKPGLMRFRCSVCGQTFDAVQCIESAVDAAEFCMQHSRECIGAARA